jgi:hypothetical protein
MSAQLKDWTLAACRYAHPIIVLYQLLGTEHVLAGGPDDDVYLMQVSEEDVRAACELAELPLPAALRR